MALPQLAQDTSADLRVLKAEFKQRGFYVKPTGKILFQLSLHVLTVAVGIALTLAANGLWLAGLGVLVLAIGATGVATNTHTAAHYATSKRRWVNRTLTYLGYPLFLGMGATHWWHKHNILHHGHPNVIGLDDDIRLTPWFAFSQADLPEHSRLGRLYYRIQWIGIPIAAFTMGMQIQVVSFVHIFSVWRSEGRLTRAHWLDLALLLTHWALWVGLPLLLLPPLFVLAVTVLRIGILSCFLFALFVPAHFPLEAVVLPQEGGAVDHFLLQTSTTLNFRTGLFGSWIASGLQYQVTHHLFPGISHVHYRHMNALVKSFCERHGYPFRTLGWGEAMWKTCLNFVNPKPVTPSVERAA